MGTSRWESNVHFWDYSAESPEPYPGMDAYRTGEAYIYNKEGFALGIVTIMSGKDEMQGVKLADAIKQARKFLLELTRPGLPSLPGTPSEEAERSKQDQTFLFTWNGQKIRRLLP
jgi:hypothetical protein